MKDIVNIAEINDNSTINLVISIYSEKNKTCCNSSKLRFFKVNFIDNIKLL